MSQDAYMALLKAGRIAEARAMLEVEIEKARFAPDTTTAKDGTVTFTRRGKEVEQDADGYWRLKK